jgi:formylglycine-generating enzyme
MNRHLLAIRTALSALALWTCVAVNAELVATTNSITDIAMVPRLTIQSAVSVTNQIEYRTSLDEANWVVLTRLLVTNSPYVYIDVNAPPAPQRFYRCLAFTTTNAPPPTNALATGMVTIPAGSFMRGDANDDNLTPKGDPGDAPTYMVYVSGFSMDTNLISYAVWTNVYHWAIINGYSFTTVGSHFATASHPVHTVTWYDAVKWCNARSEKEGLTPCYYANAGQTTVYRSGVIALATNYVNWAANGYRLPTEAEWEKAARGGIPGQRFPLGNYISQNDARYTSASFGFSYDLSPRTDQISTTNVGSFVPNGLGLYDMAGNVREWCWDGYSGTYYKTNQVDPKGPASGASRVVRGGSWNDYPYLLRCAQRNYYPPAKSINAIGFRCVQKE